MIFLGKKTYTFYQICRTGAVPRKCSKDMLSKNLLQNSQENTSAGDCFLINPSGLLRKKTLLQSNSGTDVFF